LFSQLNKPFLCSELCYFGTTKVEMVKFATVMANDVKNYLKILLKNIELYRKQRYLFKIVFLYCTLYKMDIAIICSSIASL